MNHIGVLQRAWHITWRYRALWVFGIILALVTGGGARNGASGGGGGGGGGSQSHGGALLPDISAQVQGALIAALVGFGCLVLFLVIVSIVARWVAETSLIRMVDDYEETGTKHKVGQGFRLGWSRTAFRLFLIDLVVTLPLIAAFIVLFAIALAPLLLWLTEETAVGIVGTVATIGLTVLVILLAIVIGVTVSLLMLFFRRACALESLGVIEAIKHGYNVVRRHLKDVAIMWLLMVGIRLAVTLMMIPIIAALLVVGALIGALPAILTGGLTSLFAEGAIPWITGALVAVPILILVVALPLLFLGGLMEVFKSSVWTLTYRELRALEYVAAGPEPPLEPEILLDQEPIGGE